MHDNAPIHTAAIIQEWLLEHGIEVMDWPPYSPDLNPIENLWALLKAEVYRLHPNLLQAPNTIATLNQLMECAIETWEVMSDTLLLRLLDSMVARRDAVIAANGWYTKY